MDEQIEYTSRLQVKQGAEDVSKSYAKLSMAWEVQINSRWVQEEGVDTPPSTPQQIEETVHGCRGRGQAPRFQWRGLVDTLAPGTQYTNKTLNMLNRIRVQVASREAILRSKAGPERQLEMLRYNTLKIIELGKGFCTDDNGCLSDAKMARISCLLYTSPSPRD